METMLPNIVQSVYGYLETQRKGWAPACNYASQVGHPCERNLVYQRLNWQEKLLPPPSKLLVFRDGNVHEADILKLLNEAGIAVIEQQRPFDWKELELRGKIDGRIKIENKAIPLEIKSINPHDFEKINSVEDLLKSPKPWTRGYVAQMMVYLLMMNESEGIMLFKNKATGQLKQINVSLDYGFAEDICKKLENVNRHVKKGSYPERITDRTVCQYCDFKHICLVDESTESINISDDPEILELVEQRQALKPQVAAFEEIDDKLKEIWKTKENGTYLIGGRFQVKISSFKRAFYNVPDEIKNKYKEETEHVKAIITTLK